ncbi:uncharacterized protein EURHEDRAFT_467239 [Aspergillus ruber CBS 135680]|uniref:Uncharacterized protein n=1 Tax=Aspergillus ruber (strain CBS 135680) TaxID=1388766 RepID=A0A017S030_ASPRC|nr:uncharacterized protein EURHEDRAFT_467239 [Aspergillus ruber CBS 135680]EYE90393.1 hypothetical protein EURHEDRAFT_467239 [Aspergillus ruber CBS 135680]
MTSTDQPPANIIPLDSPLRITPIHPLLPDIRVPGRPADTEAQSNGSSKDQPNNEIEKPLQSHHYNPLTCAPFPFSNASLNQLPNIETQEEKELADLREEHPTPEAALRAQEATAREAKRRIEETVKKREEVQRAMDKKVKERDTEMKVLEKYQEVKVKASDILPS